VELMGVLLLLLLLCRRMGMDRGVPLRGMKQLVKLPLLLLMLQAWTQQLSLLVMEVQELLRQGKKRMLQRSCAGCV